MSNHVLSPVASEALQILAASIRAGRLQRRWSVTELAERIGVSRPTVTKIERGDPGVAVGTTLEAAALLGIALFDEQDDVRAHYGARRRAELALLPAAARRPKRAVDDDF